MSAVNLMLVGRTGNGKSSTGNSILGRKEFTPRIVSSQICYEIKKGTATLDGRTITVVDGPGLGDTTTDLTEDGQSMIELVQRGLLLISNRLHVLILVLKYGLRFTNQENYAVKMIKAIFGEDVLWNHGIILLSNGDNFDLDKEDEQISFETWCTQQSGDIQSLFHECRGRFVLFNNRSKDRTVLKKQNDQLMKMVTDITTNTQPYSEEDFKKCERSRSKLLVKGKLPELRASTERILNSLVKQIEQIAQDNSWDHASNILKLTRISDKLEEHVLFLKDEDDNTGFLWDLLVVISITKSRLKTMIDLQTLQLQMAQTGEAWSVGRNPEDLLKETQCSSLKRFSQGVVSAFRSCFECVKYSLWINNDKGRSFPINYRTLLFYVISLSLIGLVFYNTYSR